MKHLAREKQRVVLVFTTEESGENPKQMRYRDCRKASVGNSFFIDRDDPTQSGSDHTVLQQFLELLSKAFFGFDGSSFFVWNFALKENQKEVKSIEYYS